MVNQGLIDISTALTNENRSLEDKITQLEIKVDNLVSFINSMVLKSKPKTKVPHCPTCECIYERHKHNCPEL